MINKIEATAYPRKYFGSKSCAFCHYKPCDRLSYGGIYPENSILSTTAVSVQARLTVLLQS
jgi:hypothetical protein